MHGVPDERLARGALQALHDAVASLRQHPEHAGLQRAVLKKAHAALQAATAHGPLAIALRDAVAPGPTGEPPFGPLRAAGVGELVLLPGLTVPELQRLVQHLATPAPADDPEQAVRRLRGDAGLAHVQLRAAATSDFATTADEPLDWTAMPLAAARSPALAALVARDLASNLPALVARQILDDLASEPAAPDGMLQRLLTRLLDGGDLATASWLLAAVADDAPHLAEDLRRTAAARVDQPWLSRMLAHGTQDELMQLCTFVMQLPDEVGARFAELLAATAHPLARWLRELLV